MKIAIVIIFSLLVLFGPDAYIYGLLFQHTPFRWTHLLYWLPQLVLIALIIAFFLETDQTTKYRHVGFSVFALLCLQFPKVFFTIISLIGQLGTLLHLPLMPFNIAGLVFGGIALGTLLYGCFVELYKYEVKHIEYSSSEIPKAFDGYTIVHLSDIHSGSWNPNAKEMDKAIELINAQNPDLILFTGDLVTNDHTEIDPFFNSLKKMKAKDGIISVLGNHDYSFLTSSRDTLKKLIEKERNLGWHLLLNENAIIHRGNDSIAIIGVENVGKPPFPHVGDLAKASKGTDGMFRILLSHDPTHWREEVLPKTDIPLTLSGHTHAGQFDLPFLSLSKHSYSEYRGLYTEGKQSIYVNAGLGYTLIPIRVNARPEITIIKLVMSNE